MKSEEAVFIKIILVMELESLSSGQDKTFFEFFYPKNTIKI